MLWKKTNWKTRKKWGGGGITAKNSSIPAENSSYPADCDKNCKKLQYLDNVQNNCKNSINKNKGESTINCVRVARTSCGENTIKNAQNVNIENLEFKNDFTNNILSNNNLDNTNKKIAPSKNSYKNNMKTYSAATKICLWLFVFVACLAFVIGFGDIGGSNESGSLKVAPEIKTASAEGATWSGSGTQASPYQIANYADLLALSTACNTPTSGTTYNHFEGVYFKLTTDITIAAADLNDTTTSTSWTPIACDLTGANYSNCYFSGNFNGNGKTITYAGDVTKTFTSGTVYYGLLFGHVKGTSQTVNEGTQFTNGNIHNINIKFGSSATTAFNVNFSSSGSTSVYLKFGGLIGYLNTGKISSCKFSGKSLVLANWSGSWNGGNSCFAGVVADARSSEIRECQFNSNFVFENINCDAIFSAVFVGWANGVTIDQCKTTGNLTFDAKTQTARITKDIGGIVGKGDDVVNISNCSVNGNFYSKWNGNSTFHCGVIAGSATNISNCIVGGEAIIEQGDGAAMPSFGLIAGIATSVTNCCASVSNATLYAKVGAESNTGLIVGNATTVSNCSVNAQLQALSVNNSSGYSFAGFIVGGGEDKTTTVSNCIAIVSVAELTGSIKAICSSTTVNAYNCVVITSVTNVSTAYALSSSNTSTTDKTNGLYSLTSTNANLSELKNKNTYTNGTSNFSWKSTAPWDFANTWMIKSNTNNGYPFLQLAITSYNITLSVSTNLGGTTTGSTAAIDQFIIYRLDELGNIVNQFVVRNGSTITFEADKNKAITILVNYKLYMVATIGNESTNKKTFTPTDDTTVNISITAPAGVNNWIVI